MLSESHLSHFRQDNQFQDRTLQLDRRQQTAIQIQEKASGSILLFQNRSKVKVVLEVGLGEAFGPENTQLSILRRRRCLRGRSECHSIRSLQKLAMSRQENGELLLQLSILVDAVFKPLAHFLDLRHATNNVRQRVLKK